MTDLGPFLVAPRVVPALDPGFRPLVLARRRLTEFARRSPESLAIAVGVERPGGAIDVRESWVFPDGHPAAEASRALLERLVKSMLWSRGGFRVWVDGPESVVAALRRHYDEDDAGRFDASMMERAYDCPLEVIGAPRAAFPLSRVEVVTLGGHLEGCRIGFDLGASDRKAAAVIDGEPVFSEEVLWDPSHQTDPQWHFDQIDDSLRRAAEHLPRVDAIGGSAAGIYVDSEVRVASLFRSVPEAAFGRVRGLFRELQAAWGGIPFEVANDGDVTALAGALFNGVRGLLGIAMGSSEAAGYVTPEGGLTRWLNELAFTPIDLAPDAPVDEWSGDRGCGVRYFSQQCLPRLLPAAGIDVDPASPLPARLAGLQELMAAGDERAAAVYGTIGTQLGYSLMEYREGYEFDHVQLLGRVMTGPGGDAIEAAAKHVLSVEEASPIAFHEVSEREKRHGQAVAAASLPGL